jgi:hypothetical protein
MGFIMHWRTTNELPLNERVVIGGEGPNEVALNSIEVLDLNNPHEWKPYPVS